MQWLLTLPGHETGQLTFRASSCKLLRCSSWQKHICLERKCKSNLGSSQARGGHKHFIFSRSLELLSLPHFQFLTSMRKSCSTGLLGSGARVLCEIAAQPAFWSLFQSLTDRCLPRFSSNSDQNFPVHLKPSSSTRPGRSSGILEHFGFQPPG